MYDFLDKISSTDDVKKLNIHEAEILSDEIRDFLIDSVSKTGGHLASNLGVVELTIALIKAFDFPNDKIVWDVGHQSYVYKLLTGRKDRFDSLRQFDGIAGFPKRSESIFDSFNTGHASTSISAALGLNEANYEEKGTFSVAVIGDGALTGGLSTEALENAAELNKNFIVILNDNNMSISKSVGGFTKHLTKLRSATSYLSFKSKLDSKLSKTKFGKRLIVFMKLLKDSIKHLFVGNSIFENFGFAYFGPIDGHDIETMTFMFERAKKIQAPVLLHVLTTKGKGYKFAEDHPETYHGVSTFEAANGVKNSENITYSRVVGDTLCKLAEKDRSISVVTAAMATGTGTDEFAEKYPERFYDVGIAEQHAVTFAAGLAAGKKKPFVVIYSSFLQRAYDQILHDVCLQNLNVTFLIDRAGIVGEDGETHHGLFDIGFMTQMPNMLVLSPVNFTELVQMIDFAASGKYDGPIAIRYPRGKSQYICDNAPDFSPGKAQLILNGDDVCIFSCGAMTQTAVEISNILSANNISTTVVNMRTVYPLNSDLIADMASHHKLLVTLEDGSVSGGIGEKISACVASLDVRVKCINFGFPAIVTHGSCDKLLDYYGLNAETIAHKILNFTQKD